jgi:uncharacterized protein (TIGR03382 family)
VLRPALLLFASLPLTAYAEDRFVGGAGDPYATIDEAFRAAADGDVIVVRAGTYAGAIVTRADGVTIRGEGEVVLTHTDRVIDVAHDRFTLENVIVDAQMAMSRAIRVQGNGFTLRDAEVRNTRGHCSDLRDVDDLTIEDTLIHHCIHTPVEGCADPSCQNDAHGIVGGAVQGMVVRNVEIHTFSGDAIQLDSNWSSATRQWNDVLIEGCRFWMAPLAEPTGGFAAGVNPAENAIDTKTNGSFDTDATMTIRDTIAYGFRSDLIGNAAAFNLKQDVIFTIDRVTVYDSEIAFRIRGAGGDHGRGARPTITNTVIYDVTRAIRYEDGLASLGPQHVTFGGEIGTLFEDESTGGPSVIQSANVLVLGALPEELAGGTTNLVAYATAFVDAAAHDYHLAAGASEIDTGTDTGVALDRDAIARPQGAGFDVGAFEFCTDCTPVLDASVGGDGGGPARDGGPRADGAGGADAGATSTSDDGCGCAAGDTPSALVLLLFVAWFVSRRSAAGAR